MIPQLVYVGLCWYAAFPLLCYLGTYGNTSPAASPCRGYQKLTGPDQRTFRRTLAQRLGPRHSGLR